MARRILLGLAMVVGVLLGCVVVILASMGAVFATLRRAWQDRRVFEREREQGSK